MRRRAPGAVFSAPSYKPSLQQANQQLLSTDSRGNTNTDKENARVAAAADSDAWTNLNNVMPAAPAIRFAKAPRWAPSPDEREATSKTAQGSGCGQTSPCPGSSQPETFPGPKVGRAPPSIIKGEHCAIPATIWGGVLFAAPLMLLPVHTRTLKLAHCRGLHAGQC